MATDHFNNLDPICNCSKEQNVIMGLDDPDGYGYGLSPKTTPSRSIKERIIEFILVSGIIIGIVMGCGAILDTRAKTISIEHQEGF